MRSYYAHLGSAVSEAEGPIAIKPIFRASAIFPVFHSAQVSSRIIFLGYWLLKRRIQQIASVLTLREESGKIIARSNMIIAEAKSYRCELRDLLDKAERPLDLPFTGSLEIEFYSSTNLFFPYPAVDINYYGPNFTSIVHTAQRVYNDYDDLQRNSQTKVPESGFNLYANANSEPFISLINGSVPVVQRSMQFEFFNARGDHFSFIKQIGQLSPYETLVIYPARECSLKEFFQGQPGYCKVQFYVDWIFPRLLVGNLCRDPEALSITHTYYDCTQADSKSDYWELPGPEWHPASLMIPVDCTTDHFTNIYFYPIYSISKLALAIEIYDKEGVLLGRKNPAVVITSPGQASKVVKFQDLLEELGILSNQKLAARLFVIPIEGSFVPARMKLGLDCGRERQGLPCNICTNLQPYVPKFSEKTHSFKWAPLLADQPRATLWLMNSSPAKDYQRPAVATLSFYREKDCAVLNRDILLSAQGFDLIDTQFDSELQQFMQDTIGWCTIVTDNPYLTTYYFAESAAGLIGGDHGF